jgi:hypothetical protein
MDAGFAKEVVTIGGIFAFRARLPFLPRFRIPA